MSTSPELPPALAALHEELGIPADYATDPYRPRYVEAEEVAEAGPNLLGRMQRLTPIALAAWHRMSRAAADEGITMLLVSGFRAIDYQADLIRNKLAAGQSLAEILEVVAAPGFSEHHTGRALDIASPGSRPLTEEFEDSDAFRWLEQRAGEFGFFMTYPRNNAFGFVFEPWHWCYQEVEV